MSQYVGEWELSQAQERSMTLEGVTSSSSLGRKKPRGTKQSIAVVEAKTDMRVHAEIHPPLQSGKAHTIDIKKGTQGLVCGSAPDGMEGQVVAFDFSHNCTATAVVARDQIIRI